MLPIYNLHNTSGDLCKLDLGWNYICDAGSFGGNQCSNNTLGFGSWMPSCLLRKTND